MIEQDQSDQVMVGLLEATSTLLSVKERMIDARIAAHTRRLREKKVHVALVEKTEADVIRVVKPWIREQVEAIASGLERLSKSEAGLWKKSTQTDLIRQVFNPWDWTASLIDNVLPVLAVGSTRAAVGQFLSMGVDIRRTKCLVRMGVKFNPYHDDQGRFATGGGVHLSPDTGGGTGGGGGTSEIRTKWDRETKAGKKIVREFTTSDGITVRTIVDGTAKSIPRQLTDPKFASSVLEEAGTRKYIKDLGINQVVFQSGQARGPQASTMAGLSFVHLYVDKHSIAKDVSSHLDHEVGHQAFDKFNLSKDTKAVLDAEWEKAPLTVQITVKSSSLAGVGSKEAEYFCVTTQAHFHEPSVLKDLPKIRELLSRVWSDDFQGSAKYFYTSTKSTTASRWLYDNVEDIYALEEMVQAAGVDGLSIITEMPQSMKLRIAKYLKESFQQDYWTGISEATGLDASNILRRGLREGMSIVDMATLIRESLGGDDYAKVRAFNIARTESGNALNGARRASMDQLLEDLGQQLDMQPAWLSVLGPTTRATHANLDGVPADKDGMWELSGYRIPWPGHWSLSAAERCNCQCTISVEFGLREGQAQEMIQDYYNRQWKSVYASEKFNPYHDHLGRFSSSSRGGGVNYKVEHFNHNEGTRVGVESLDWKGDRGVIGRTALQELKMGHPGFILKDSQGEVKGILSYYCGGSPAPLKISFLATKERGWGSKMMAVACEKAAKENRWLQLKSVSDAKGFYRKMGMREVKLETDYTLAEFEFTPVEARQFVDRMKKS